MVRTKQTPQGGASHRPGGMTTATFTGTGRSEAAPEEQFKDTPEVDTEEDLPLVLEDAVKKPKESKQGANITVRKLRSRQVRLSHDQNI